MCKPYVPVIGITKKRLQPIDRRKKGVKICIFVRPVCCNSLNASRIQNL